MKFSGTSADLLESEAGLLFRPSRWCTLKSENRSLRRGPGAGQGGGGSGRGSLRPPRPGPPRPGGQLSAGTLPPTPDAAFTPRAAGSCSLCCLGASVSVVACPGVHPVAFWVLKGIFEYKKHFTTQKESRKWNWGSYYIGGTIGVLQSILRLLPRRNDVWFSQAKGVGKYRGLLYLQS